MFKSSKIFDQKGFAPIILTLLTAILIACGFYYASVYKIKLTKESTTKIQADFETLSLSVNELGERFTDESGVNLTYQDINAAKNSIDKTKSIAEKVRKDADNLSDSLSKKQPGVDKYTSLVEEYYKDADQYLKFIQGGFGLMDGIVNSYDGISAISDTLDNTNSDSQSLSEVFENRVDRIEKSIKDVEKIDVNSDFIETKEDYLAYLRIMKNNIIDLSQAMQNSESGSLNIEEATSLFKKMNNTNKILEDKHNAFKTRLKEKVVMIEKEYNNLDQKYK